jgi:predicted NBD/HSP70 family sugar kinase
MIAPKEAGAAGRAPAAMNAPSLCVTCGARPPIGTLSRCVACLRSAADADRTARLKAREARDRDEAERIQALQTAERRPAPR